MRSAHPPSRRFGGRKGHQKQHFFNLMLGNGEVDASPADHDFWASMALVHCKLIMLNATFYENGWKTPSDICTHERAFDALGSEV